MDALFNTSLFFKGQEVDYAVYFQDEAYHFVPASGAKAEIVLQRKDDEWHTIRGNDSELVQNATEALDRYLLSQH